MCWRDVGLYVTWSNYGVGVGALLDVVFKL